MGRPARCRFEEGGDVAEPELTDTTSYPGGFRGPYADGPPPEALAVDAPSLYSFGFTELRRAVVVVAVVIAYVAGGVARWLQGRLIHPRARRPGETLAVAASEALIDSFVALGPTFVKLGQLMASSPSVFPSPLTEVALRCIREISPFDGATARSIIEQDLGRPPSEIFAHFEDRPLSAASVAQVHACVLPGERQAVLKLRRPAIRSTMATDLRIIRRLAGVLERLSGFARDANLTGAIEDLHVVTFNELNFALEAHRQVRFRDGIGRFGDNTGVTAPEVYWEFCGPRVICMERLYGVALDDFAAVRARNADGEMQLRRGVKVWMEGCLVHGPFHGDVHAGNIWTLDDGRVAFLDFGIMGELNDDWKQLMQDIFMTSTIDDDFTRVARSFKRVGAFPEEAGTDDEIGARMQMVFGPMFDVGLSEISMSSLLASIIRTMGQYAGGTPRELQLIVKQLLYFERYSKELGPHWKMFRDLYLVKNIFPEAAAKKAAELGIELPD
jgi:predicted unusual protein kinase regulating ubiquinone biosynthesis (AarF/ABC1/UbiB family)